MKKFLKRLLAAFKLCRSPEEEIIDELVSCYMDVCFVLDRIRLQQNSRKKVNIALGKFKKIAFDFYGIKPRKISKKRGRT